MRRRPVQPGDLLTVALPRHVPPGHEQHGPRPVIVIGLPERLGTPRFPMLLVVPITTQIGSWAQDNPNLYPSLQAGEGGLSQPSVALLDQLRGIDRSRVGGFIGSRSEEAFAPIRDGIRRMFGL